MKEKLNIWKLIKTIVYILLAILVVVFRESLVREVGYLVGSLMMMYGIEKVIVYIVEKKGVSDIYSLTWGATEILLGIITAFLIEEYDNICVIWAIWAILREVKEIEEIVIEFKEKKVVGILSIIESIVLTVFSVLLLIEPGEHHAMTHIYLLSVELITTALFPQLDYFIKHIRNKKEANL